MSNFRATIFSGKNDKPLKFIGPFPTLESAARAAVISAYQIPETDMYVRVYDAQNKLVRSFLLNEPAT